MLTIIIPTVQKNKEILDALVKECTENSLVREIIIIDNSCKGYYFDSDKLKVIIPKHNLYVNPAWNLGVKETKTKYFALLNDDILMPINMLEQVVDFLDKNSNTGVIGMDTNSITNKTFYKGQEYPSDKKIEFEKIGDNICFNWGCAIFGQKSLYEKIPNDLKIWRGDDYLIFANTKKHKSCYKIMNGNLLHLGSLTCSSEALYDIKRNDLINYLRIDPKHKRYMSQSFMKKYKIDTIDFTPIYKRIFSVENKYKNNKKHKIIRFIGIKIKIAIKTGEK